MGGWVDQGYTTAGLEARRSDAGYLLISGVEEGLEMAGCIVALHGLTTLLMGRRPIQLSYGGRNRTLSTSPVEQHGAGAESVPAS